jgi:hypothetical protein
MTRSQGYQVRRRPASDHKKCFTGVGIIFVLPDKQAVLRDLQLLGYDPEKEYVRTFVASYSWLNITDKLSVAVLSTFSISANSTTPS